MPRSQETATLEIGDAAPQEVPCGVGKTQAGFTYSLFAAVALIAAISLLRLPWILFPHELNVDESQMLSQGMKFLVDVVPWRSVDGTSSGPLNSYLVSLFLLAGVTPGYVFAHLLADALVCLQLLIAHQTLLRLTTGSRKAAACGILPMILFYGFTSLPDYLHYSSELLPALLLALAFLFFLVWLDGDRDRSRASESLLLFSTGLALGAAPFCKLQSLPIAVALGATMLAASLADAKSAPQPSQRIRGTMAFFAGALLPAAAILGLVTWGGALQDFWLSYIRGNIAYAGPLSWATTLNHLERTDGADGLQHLLLTAALAAVVFVSAVVESKRLVLSRRDAWVFGGLSLYGGAALFAVSRPSTWFPHYTIFALHPVTYLGIALLYRLAPLADSVQRARLKVAYWVGAAVVIAVIAGHIFLGIKVAAGPPRPPTESNNKIAAVVSSLKNESPVSTVAIWGWTPGVYVLTGIPPATRDAIGHFVISAGPLQGYFRKRFVNDLRSKRPDLFIDAVAPGAFMWSWTQKDGYESDPDLKSFIDENYVQVAELPLVVGSKKPLKPVRFFARQDLRSRWQ